MELVPRTFTSSSRDGWTYPVSSTHRLCKTVSWPFHRQDRRKRVWHFGSTGSCNRASCHVRPPAGHERGRAEFESSEPLHINIALESRQKEPQGVSLFGAQRLAVLAIADHCLLQDFRREGNAAVQSGRVAAFREHPGGITAHAGRIKKCGQLHAGPLARAGQSVSILNGKVLRVFPSVPGIAGALDKGEPRAGGQPLQFFDGENQRLLD